jgi:hypothetical protein
MMVAKMHLTDPVPSVLDLRPDLQPSWDEIIHKAMAKDSADRHATAGEMAHDVEQVASGRWFFRKLVYD